MAGGFHNPFPSSLRHECEKAREILDSFINPKIAHSTHTKILQNAQGLVIFSIFKLAFLGSARFGSGILVARLDDGSWSAPSAIGTGGVGFGGQFGFEFANFVFVLPKKSSVKTFAELGSLVLTANISLAFGPTGRCGEIGMGVSSKGTGPMWSMSKTNGLFGGVSIEAGTIIESRASNRKFYQKNITASQLLNGEIEAPADAEPLMRYLAHPAFQLRPDSAADPEQAPVEGVLEASGGSENQPPNNAEMSAPEAPRSEAVALPVESHSTHVERSGEPDVEPQTGP